MTEPSTTPLTDLLDKLERVAIAYGHECPDPDDLRQIGETKAAIVNLFASVGSALEIARESLSEALDKNKAYALMIDIERELIAELVELEGSPRMAETIRKRIEGEEKEAADEISDEFYLRRTMADLLSRTAVALKGPGAPLRRHSFHDLPELAAQAMDKLRDASTYAELQKRALDTVMVGGNHLASYLGGELGPSFSEEVPPTMPHDQALELLPLGIYDVWCCWAAIMRARDSLPERENEIGHPRECPICGKGPVVKTHMLHCLDCKSEFAGAKEMSANKAEVQAARREYAVVHQCSHCHREVPKGYPGVRCDDCENRIVPHPVERVERIPSQGTAVGPDSAKSPCACPEDRCLYPCRDGEFCRRGWMREAGVKGGA